MGHVASATLSHATKFPWVATSAPPLVYCASAPHGATLYVKVSNEGKVYVVPYMYAAMK